MLRYVLSMIGFVIGLVVFVTICWFLCSLRTWYYYEPLYKVLMLVKDYLILIMTVIILMGWTLITHHFINLPLRYLDEITKKGSVQHSANTVFMGKVQSLHAN